MCSHGSKFPVRHTLGRKSIRRGMPHSKKHGKGEGSAQRSAASDPLIPIKLRDMGSEWRVSSGKKFRKNGKKRRSFLSRVSPIPSLCSMTHSRKRNPSSSKAHRRLSSILITEPIPTSRVHRQLQRGRCRDWGSLHAHSIPASASRKRTAHASAAVRLRRKRMKWMATDCVNAAESMEQQLEGRGGVGGSRFLISSSHAPSRALHTG